jgi:peroxiredoxin
MTGPRSAKPPGRPPAARSTPAPPADRVEIRIAPVPGPNGPVRPTEFVLHLADNRGVQELKSENGAVRVLPGDYWLTGWTVTIPDAQGRRWKARGGVLGTPPLSTHVPARRGRPVEIRLGTPLATAVVPTIKGRTANFVMTFVGTLGDRCYQVSLDDGKPPLPHMKILDEHGQLVERVDFCFGCSFLCRLTWKVPQGLSGTFRAVPEVDFGPIAVMTGSGTEFTIAPNASDEEWLAVGRPAPEFTLADAERGASVSLSSLRGHPVALNFFCGCQWCEAVAQQWAKNPALPDGTQVVAILNDASLTTPAAIRKFRERTGFQAMILADPDQKATTLYDASGCPRVWVLDAEGTLRHVNASRTDPAEQIVREAAEALAAKPAAVGAAPAQSQVSQAR